MGNKEEWKPIDYEYTSLVDDIMTTLNIDGANDEAANILNNIIRRNGLKDRIIIYLDSCWTLYESTEKQYKKEWLKIFYLFYTLEQREGVNVLELLSKPSMESIDNSVFEMTNINGSIIAEIKDSLERELSPDLVNSFNGALNKIICDWNNFIKREKESIRHRIDYDASTSLTLKHWI